MRRRVGWAVAIAACAVLLATVLLATPAAASASGAPAFGPSQGEVLEASEFGQNRTVSVVYAVELPGDDGDRMELTIRVEDVQGQEVSFRLRGSDLEIRAADGFTADGTRLTTTGATSNASITVAYDPSEQLVSPVRDDFAATSEWALFRVMVSTPSGVSLDERVEPDGVRGEQFVFVGAHETYERSVGADRIVLVAPEAAEFADSPDEIADTLEVTSRYLRIDAREQHTLAIAAPEELRRGGLVGGSGGEFWVSADIPLSWNSWTHEYVHLRQDRIEFTSAWWLVEAEARYYQHLIAAKSGHLEGPGSSGFEAFESQLRSYAGHEDVELRDPGTWERESNYEKGARVLAALDVEIRQRTDGERDYRHVMHELNQREVVTDAVFREVVEEIAGEPMDDFLDPYVAGTDMPPVPDDSEVYRQWPFEPDVTYNVTEAVTTGAPSEAAVPDRPVFTNESVSVTYSIENDGIDPLLYPEIEINPPDGWIYEGFEIAGDGWRIEGPTTAGGTDVPAAEPTRLVVHFETPDRATETAAIGFVLTDQDGKSTETSTRMTTVRPVEANLSVEEPVHEPGTTVTLDASQSEVPREVASYEWDLTGDGAIDRVTDAPRLNETYDPGARQVSVTVTNDIGVWDTATAWVNTTDTPVISVEERIVTDADETFEIPVNVSNVHGETRVVWELPDGNTTTGEPGVFRASPGYHELGVSAVDEYGGTNRTVVEIISVDQPELSPVIPGVVPDEREVTLAVIVHKQVGTYHVTWELPGGVEREGLITTAELPIGEHNVTMRVVDEFGNTANVTRTVTVSDVPSVSLEAPVSATSEEPVALQATIENEFGNVTATWHVEGETIHTEAEHQLSRTFSPGEHEIVVRVTDEHGLSAVAVHELSVEAPAAPPEETPDPVPGFGGLAAAVAMIVGVTTWWLLGRPSR